MILDRPLFRQTGGPIMPPDAPPMPPGPPPMEAGPPPMPAGPPPMPPGPPPGSSQEDTIQAVEDEATGAGEQLGLDYLQSVTSALDGAEDYEQAINAIRGNALPLQERYDELADYVGEADASSTPESVLTMVQPTIMLTEEGSVDSGIGALMEEIMGGIEMEDTPDMGGGIGELMLAGQPEPPIPVQGFAYGGPVQHYARAGEVDSIKDYYAEYLPLYQEIMGGSEDYDRQQRNLDIARAGFAFAGGVDPTTGKSMAGQPLLSQAGRALAPVATGRGERLAAQRKSDQTTQLAALQSGISSREAALKREFDVETQLAKEARQKADKTVTLSPGQTLFTAQGKEIVSVPKDAERRTVTVAPGSVVLDQDTGEVIYTAPEDPSSRFGKSTIGVASEIITDAPLLLNWGRGQTTADEDADIEFGFQYWTSPKSVWDAASGQMVERPGNVATPTMVRAYEARNNIGRPFRIPAIDMLIERNRASQLVEPTVGEMEEDQEAFRTIMFQYLPEGFDFTTGTGAASWIGIPANGIQEIIGELVGERYAPIAPGAELGVPYLNGLNTQVLLHLKEANEGRENREIDLMIKKLEPEVGELMGGDRKAWRRLQSLAGYLDFTLDTLEKSVTAGTSSQAMYTKDRKTLMRMQGLRDELELVIQSFDTALNQATDIDLSIFDPRSPNYQPD
jgi:hypothetical protein